MNKDNAVCSFRVFGLKMETCEDESSVDKVRKIQKSLYGNKDWIYFYKNFDVNDEKSECVVSKNAFDDCLIYNNERQSISICAIVGKNGTGKSTIMDMIIRILNNISASIIGEGDVYPAAAHLHYIDNVYASLAAFIKGKIYIISCKGRDLSIKKYEKKVDYLKDKDTYVCDDEFILLNKENSDSKIGLLGQEKYEELLGELFYTAVFNYSLYAYNYNDYQDEITPTERLRDLDVSTQRDDSFWLKGLFYKNDGYQTPIAINPMRENGMMNIIKENKLAKERLLSLLFYEDEDKKFPFRIINENLKIVGLRIKKLDNDKYDRDYVMHELGIDESEPIAINFRDKSRLILGVWMDVLGFIGTDVVLNEKATCNYIVYKTIKISIQYRKYEMLYSWLNDEKDNYDSIRMYIMQLMYDHSHITVKLRRALNFLKWNYIMNWGEFKRISLDELYDVYDECQEISVEVDEDGAINSFTIKEELLPPPSVSFDFDIVPVDKIKQNGSYDKSDIVPFEGLSSGERQIAYTISNVMYHLVNINSVWMDFNTEHKKHKSDYRYSNVNILFDELELYFHPELQRMFITYLLTALNSVELKYVKGLNIMMVTHSPFVISDLPKENVLFLGNSMNMLVDNTFAANISELLNNHFFLGQSIGELAVRKLKSIINVFKNVSDASKRKEEYMMNGKQYHYIQSIIGDKYLKRQIGSMLGAMDVEYNLMFADDGKNELEEYKKKIKILEDKLKKYETGKI